MEEEQPYKSFKKKYKKMEVQFSEKMSLSEDLYMQDVMARRIFQRLLRQKNQLVDMLDRINNPDHLAQEAQIAVDGEVKEGARKDHGLTELGQHYKRLVDDAYEFATDERPLPRNPVGLIEWLKRNQPTALASEQLGGVEQAAAEEEKPQSKPKKKTTKKRKNDEVDDHEEVKRKKVAAN